MLKGKLLIALASAVLFLGACSNEAPATTPETPETEETVTETPETPAVEEEVAEEGFTGTATLEELYDPEKADMVTISMDYVNGKPTSVNIDVILEDGTVKSELAAAGEYVMSTEEGALQWHEQIDAVEAFLTENDFNVAAINLLDEVGHTDSITGVSFKAGRYLELVQQLMDQVAAGNYGTEVATGDVQTFEFVGEKGTNVYTVEYNEGAPVSILIDTIQEDGSSKREASEAGTYVMGGELAFHEQMDLLQDFLAENNFDLESVTLTDEDGHTDAVTGVSIKVGGYLTEIQEILAK